MKDISDMTLKEVKEICLNAVAVATKHFKEKKKAIGCEEVCSFKCRDRKMGWYPGQMILCDDDLKEEK